MKRSKLLELHFRSKLIGKVKKQKLAKEIKQLRADILGNRFGADEEITLNDLQEMVIENVAV